jgi:uncharacterized protein (DUF58 family)
MLDYRTLNKLKINNSIKDITSAHEGNMHTRSKGQSLEFSEYSSYEPRDDTRRIDWNIFARTRKLYIKHYEAEKKLKANIFLDNSASMCAGDKNKLEKSVEIAKGLAYIAFNQGYEVHWHKNHLNKTLQSEIMRSKAQITKFELEESDLNKEEFLPKLLKSSVKRQELIIIISDCYTDKMSEIIKYFKYKKCKLILVYTLGQNEKEIPLTGNIKLRDSETDEEIRVEMNRNTRDLYLEKLREHENALKNEIKKYGYKVVQPNLEKDIEYVFFQEFIKEGILR